MFKIEKGIAVPGKANNGGRPAVYPFPAMSVGDSFFVAGAAAGARAAGAAHSWGRDHNVRFNTRKEGDGTRIWRLA